MFYGFDVSTTRIGIAILDINGVLLHTSDIKLSSSESLETRASIFRDKIRGLVASYEPLKVAVEAPAMMFGKGKSTAATIAKLQRFNGMVSYIIKVEMGMEAEQIDARAARREAGLKMHKIQTKKGSEKKRLVKKQVIDYVSRLHENFEYTLTPKGNPKPGTDDRADAIIVATALKKRFTKPTEV